jgi:hypothetical protein
VWKNLLLREGGVPKPTGEGEVVGFYCSIAELRLLKCLDNKNVTLNILFYHSSSSKFKCVERGVQVAFVFEISYIVQIVLQTKLQT